MFEYVDENHEVFNTSNSQPDLNPNKIVNIQKDFIITFDERTCMALSADL